MNISDIVTKTDLPVTCGVCAYWCILDTQSSQCLVIIFSLSKPHEEGWTGKTMRELWEEDRRAEEEASKVPVLKMGTSRMCETGGCGYFSDDGK